MEFEKDKQNLNATYFIVVDSLYEKDISMYHLFLKL